MKADNRHFAMTNEIMDNRNKTQSIPCKLWVFFVLSLALTQPQAKTSHDGIAINGNKAFTTQVKKCLDILKKRYPESHQFVKQHVGIIAQSSRSGMVAWHRPPMYQMSDLTAFYSETWCASTIAHDAYHSYLYKKFKPKNGDRTPERYWADFKAERLAINYQIRVARKIDAPDHEISHLEKQDGTHADVNGDGTITLQDYADRDW